jgi:hypothetical protein
MYLGINIPRAVLICGNAADGLRSMRAGTARTCVTSPPYWGLRNYRATGQIGPVEGPGALDG